MTKLTEHFSLEEMAATTHGPNVPTQAQREPAAASGSDMD